MNSVQYIDHETADEITVLRRLVKAHKRIDELHKLGVSPDNSALIGEGYREIERILVYYDRLVNLDRDQHNEAVGIIVGRFQVPQLHAGHKYIIETVRRRHQCYGIAVGSAEKYGVQGNPLPYHMRASIILEEFSDCVVLPIEDKEDDKDWSNDLDKAIGLAFPKGTVRLYGGRDSFIPRYFGQFPTSEISAVEGVSGTEIRGQVGNSPANNVEFRKGIIFATQITKEKPQ